MNNIATMRLYLRDQGDENRFSDEDLQTLFDQAITIEGAVAIGWLLTAAESGDEFVSESVGNTSASWGQPTERYKIALNMHNYWRNKDKELNGTSDTAAGLWLEMVPDVSSGTVVSRLIEHQKFLLDNFAA